MVELFFNVRGYRFQSALDVLRKSAQTDLAALSNEIKALEQKLEDYHQSGVLEGEWDEDGLAIWERDTILEHKISFANDASLELRKAFAIAAYHHWERSVQRWVAEESETAACDGSKTKSQDLGSFKELSKAAGILGYPIDPLLQHVVNLANALKHVNEKNCAKLLGCWPDIFPLGFTGPPRPSDWADAVQLTDCHLEEIFDVISKSGPTADRNS